MGATTRWRDTINKDINSAIESLIDAVDSDEKITNISWNNWHLEKTFNDNQVIKLNGRDVTYNYIKYSYDQTTVGDISESDRVIRREGFIIVYYSGDEVNYIIDQNSSAMKLLRKLLSFTGKNELGSNAFSFTNDFFIWLVYRVYNANYNVEVTSGNKSLRLESIKGFKGDTEDLQTRVSASGETVMNIISTLSFLLESSNLNQVKVDLSYTEHANISLLLQKGTINVFLNDYSGVYEHEQTQEQEIAKLYLTVYLEILPLLLQEYNMDIGNDLWSQDVYMDFINNVAETLMEKITHKIASLKE